MTRVNNPDTHIRLVYTVYLQYNVTLRDRALTCVIQSGPLNMNIRGNNKLFTLRGGGVLSKTGKRRCDCDETGYFPSSYYWGF